MKVQTLIIDGPLLLTPAVYTDERGWFSESWNRCRFAEADGPEFVQDNHSRSAQGAAVGPAHPAAAAPPGQARALHPPGGVRCGRRPAPGLSDPGPVGGRAAQRREPAPGVGAGGLRPRLLDPERVGRGAVHDRRLLEPGVRVLPGLERPGPPHRLAPAGAAGDPPALRWSTRTPPPPAWGPWRPPGICSLPPPVLPRLCEGWCQSLSKVLPSWQDLLSA
jgi:hypothetical protein